MKKLELEFWKTATRIVDKAERESRLIRNPSYEELTRLLSEELGVKRTIFGNFVAESEPTSRAEMHTLNSIDHSFGLEEHKLLRQFEEVLAKKSLILIDRIVGDKNSSVVVRGLVPVEFAHTIHGGANLFFPTNDSLKIKEPTYQILFFADESFEENKSKLLPEKDITIRLAMLADGRGVKIVRNSNYIGEYKKGVFAFEDWGAKKMEKGVFLHAGCRQDYLQSTSGEYRLLNSLIVALSANGKTTLTCQIMARKNREKSWLVQDDGGILMVDGSFHGFEGEGIFVKTEGLHPSKQRETYFGVLRPSTILENVFVTDDRDFDFHNLEQTSNGRAVVKRRDIMHASQYISVPKIDNLIMITRSPIIPAIVKLTREQAVALMIAGVALESSAGDPTKAGTIRSVFFYDPFMVGDKVEHANRFYEILNNVPNMNFYLINTGEIGEREELKGKIGVDRTMAILDSLFRGGLDVWIDSPTGLKVPGAIRLVDDIFLHPEKLFRREEFMKKLEDFYQVVEEAIEKLGEKLNPNVKNAFNN